MNAPHWKHRAVQLDLARQYERPDQIQRFIERAASWGYTHVYLYLEGRIRTVSFPYPDPATSYDKATMLRIVDFASRLGMELIPVVPCFGHVEQFIQHAPLKHLAEIPAGGKGRFGRSHGTCACPTNPDTFSFFSTYYREIADIFPSTYFHIGMDEAFDVGLCPRCKKRSLEDIFSSYVTRMAEFVENDLKRTVLMWDDMLEACPQAVSRIPNRIILCVWLYDEVFEKPWSRFFNRTRSDLVASYAKHGFRSIAACRDVSLLNVDSVTRYGRSSPACIGGLVTSWEHSTDFLEQFHPVMAYAGSLWSSPRNTVITDTTHHDRILLEFFGCIDPDVLGALKLVFSRRTWPRYSSLADHCRGFPTLQDRERQLSTDHIRATLNPSIRRTLRKTALPTWDAIQLDLKHESIQHGLSCLIPEITLESSREIERVVPKTRQYVSSRKDLLRSLASQLDDLAGSHTLFWKKARRNIPVGPLPASLNTLAGGIRALARSSAPKKRMLVRLHGFLPDRFGVPLVEIALRFNGVTGWKSIHQGCIKTHWDEQPYYEFWITTPMTQREPIGLRISVTGHGGHGFRFIEIQTPRGRYVPARISARRGIVEDAENILLDDKRWTWIGRPSVREAYSNPSLAVQPHSLSIALARRGASTYC